MASCVLEEEMKDAGNDRIRKQTSCIEAYESIAYWCVSVNIDNREHSTRESVKRNLCQKCMLEETHK